ncbi:MAG: sigma-70 family RNA polymerase sigma factor [FCB group bacterium]|jgi:RNA polymerase sigma-70 factor (ECF subfamily)
MELNDFKYYIIPFKNMMYRLALRLLKNKEDAEDAVQEAFMKLWLKRYELKIEGNLQALAMITTKNLCLDKLKGNRKQIISLDDDDILPDNLTPHARLEEIDIRNRIEAIIDAFPEQQKIIIHLRDIEGLSNDEVAEIVKMNKNAVKVALSRARTRLKNELAKQFNYIKNEN